MRVMVIGGTGFIGASLAARLRMLGHDVIAVARDGAPRCADGNAAHAVALDLAAIREPAAWHEHLRGIDAVVNCAGILQSSPTQSTTAVHAAGPAALFRACAQCGVRRVIHLSAIGIDRATPSEFSRSKLAGDQALMQLDLAWVILRPSVVIGRGAYGGSALLRGLAALPVLPVMPDTASLQIVHLDDVVAAIIFFLRADAPSRLTLELVGPRSYRFEEVVALFRAWMRWPPARHLPTPRALAWLVYRGGDLAAALGWEPPIRTTAAREMTRGATGDASRLTELTGIVPRDVAQALAQEPASVQERWFARLYLLKPLAFIVLPLFWILTGLISLGPAREAGIALVMQGGPGRTSAVLATIAGGCADLAIGAAIAWRPTARAGLSAAVLVSILYAAIASLLVPQMWLDPLGPLVKIAPIILAHAFALGILDRR
jgi:uncharacterized protein YbjT (DUF2867 family)